MLSNSLYASHIRELPPELLGQVFILCLPVCGDIVFSKNAAPLVISQVCTEWRAIALSVPTLWSSLKVVVSSNSPILPVSLVQLWLDRSGSRPLSLILELDKFPPVSNDLVVTAANVLEIFASKSHHWKALKLTLPGSCMLFHSIAYRAAPILETLSLVLRNGQHNEVDDINHLVRNAPLIHHFSWSNRQSWGSWDLQFDDVLLPQPTWLNLSHLVLDSWLSLSSLHSILRQCQNLVSCNLRRFATGTLPSDLSSLTILFLPFLKSLKIYQHILDDNLGFFLDMIVSPRLRDLSITCGRRETIQWPQPQFISFLSQSACLIEALCLEFTGITEEGLTQCLQLNTVSLVSLEVYEVWGHVCIGDDLLKRLTHQAGRDVLCPNLRVLVLYGVTRSTDGLLANMLRARHNYLECVDFRFSGENITNETDLNYLRQILRPMDAASSLIDSY